MLYSFFWFPLFSALFSSSSFITLSGKSLESTSILVREMTKFIHLCHQPILVMDLRVLKHFQRFTLSLQDINLNMSFTLTFEKNHGYESSFHSKNLLCGKNVNKRGTKHLLSCREDERFTTILFNCILRPNLRYYSPVQRLAVKYLSELQMA